VRSPQSLAARQLVLQHLLPPAKLRYLANICSGCGVTRRTQEGTW
jgi:hypothetical protein